MNWLTLPIIKQHSRIEYDCDDELLEIYAESAEQTVLNLLKRTEDELREKYGEIPAPIIQAGLMLVEMSYNNRAPMSPAQQYLIPYTFDILVKPYMKL